MLFQQRQNVSMLKFPMVVFMLVTMLEAWYFLNS